MEASVVGERLRAFLATVEMAGRGGDPLRVVDMGIQEVEVVSFEQGKKKGRDDDKLHQGFALVRFEFASTVEEACKVLDGRAMGPGARGNLTASVARSRVAKDRTLQEREERETRQKQQQLEARRAHNLGQKRRRVERMEQELEALLDSLAGPGGKLVLEKWRLLPPQGAEYAGVGRIDWDQMPAECDPSRGGGLGPEADRGKWTRRLRPIEHTLAAAHARALRKRVQVESFYLLLSQILPPPMSRDKKAEAHDACHSSAPASPVTTVVDFGCGSGNLTLPLAALMPHIHFVGGALNLDFGLHHLRRSAAMISLPYLACTLRWHVRRALKLLVQGWT
jgi:2-polyprenyl-3-methyl-5-hydroxy-6-metoxy-1,4-benzoquinol methylase